MPLAWLLAVTLLLGWEGVRRPGGDWHELRFKGSTRYSLVSDSLGARLRAESQGQSSALVRSLTLRDSAGAGEWCSERRDLEADLISAFGSLPRRIEAIGVLCDADSTPDFALAEFGVIELALAPGADPGLHRNR